MVSEDATILAEENARLRSDNARIPRLERRNRWDRFLLILTAVITFVGMGIGRLYWQAEGAQIACPETMKAAPPEPCKDGFITIGGANEFCPDTRQTGKVVEGSTRIFTCTCPHSP